MYNLKDKKQIFYKGLNYIITNINTELIVRALSRMSTREKKSLFDKI
jgi:hypothetical protein